MKVILVNVYLVMLLTSYLFIFFICWPKHSKDISEPLQLLLSLAEAYMYKKYCLHPIICIMSGLLSAVESI